jgi:hypothetical protein
VKPPLEKDVQAAIMHALRIHPKVGLAIRYNSGSMHGSNGTRYLKCNSADGHSDIGGYMKGGRAFYIEVKRVGERPTEKQAAFLELARANGVLAGVAHNIEQAFLIIGGKA